MKKFTLVLFFSLIFSSSLYAKWYFVEPSIGYHQGHYEANKLSGIGVDLKFGFNWNNMFIGGDYALAPSLTSAKVAYEIGLTNTGVVLGWNMKGWRMWYVHMMSSELSWSVSGAETSITGSGYKIGLGGKIFNELSLNIEANFLKYTESSIDGTVSDVDQFMDLVLISFSWPY